MKFSWPWFFVFAIVGISIGLGSPWTILESGFWFVTMPISILMGYMISDIKNKVS